MLTKERKGELQRINLGRLVDNGAFKFTDTFFPYTSGEIGPFYIQSGDIMKNGQDYKDACQHMKELVLGSSLNLLDPYVLSGGESRDWMFSIPLAADFGLPHVMLYKNGKTVGSDIEGKHVFHVADLNNKGSSPRDDWVPAIRKAGWKIDHIFFYVDRMESGVQVIEGLELKRHALVELDGSAWDYLSENGIVDALTYDNLMKRSEDVDGWAREMLRSDAGIKKLQKMVNDPKSIDKVVNIINNGYPDMKEEIMGRVGGIPDTSIFPKT